MKSATRLLWAVLASGACLGGRPAHGQDDPIDPIEQALAVSGWNDSVRVRLSGTVDLEGYSLSQPEMGLVFRDGDTFLNPRLSVFLDAQVGSHVYAFVQARADDGFDPGEPGRDERLDEYVLRLTPFDDSRLNLQVGKFATVVGNWTQRHGSWDNPFVTAPLPYENLTGIWDTDAAPNAFALLAWAGVLQKPVVGGMLLDQYRNVPVIWGPNYASGASAFGKAGGLEYAFEVKNTSLSSRPETWSPTATNWQNPTFSGRVGFEPNEMWNVGFSASTGTYLQPEAQATLPPGRSLGDYQEVVFGQDVSFAWHHVQLWAEAYEADFRIPGVGNADTQAYYVEAKYKFAPQFFGALRWNQQFFSDIPVPGLGSRRWSRDVSRVDIGPAYRPTAHTQVKVQYSVERQEADRGSWSELLAVQFTTRF